MALRAWFGRSKGLFRANRRRGAADDVTTYFRACAIRLMLREFAARSVAQGDVLDLSAEWMRLSVKTTLRQSDFAAATGVLVKRLCLRHHGTGMFEVALAENGAEALNRLRAGDWAGVEAIVGGTAELDMRTRSQTPPQTTEVQLAIETDLAREFAEGFNSVRQADRVSWADPGRSTAA